MKNFHIQQIRSDFLTPGTWVRGTRGVPLRRAFACQRRILQSDVDTVHICTYTCRVARTRRDVRRFIATQVPSASLRCTFSF